jgi:hypothetical protein
LRGDMQPSSWRGRAWGPEAEQADESTQTLPHCAREDPRRGGTDGTRIGNDGSDGDMARQLTLHLLGRVASGIEDGTLPVDIEEASSSLVRISFLALVRAKILTLGRTFCLQRTLEQRF